MPNTQKNNKNIKPTDEINNIDINNNNNNNALKENELNDDERDDSNYDILRLKRKSLSWIDSRMKPLLFELSPIKTTQSKNINIIILMYY